MTTSTRRNHHKIAGNFRGGLGWTAMLCAACFGVITGRPVECAEREGKVVDASVATDWPQFRGPTGQGLVHTSPDDLPLSWSESENVVWKIAVPGKGWSSPVIQGNDLWLTTATQTGRSLRAICFDLKTGKIRVSTDSLFHVDPETKGLAKAGNAAPTPILANDRVFVHFGTHGTACLDRDGKVLWKRVIPYYHHHGPGSSPVLAGDVLIIVCDGFTGPFFDKVERPGIEADQFVIGLDAATGDIRWKTPRDGKHSYATPLLVEIEGERQVVCPGGDGVWAYDPETGTELWSYRFVGHSNVPRPVAGNGHIFVCTGYNQASLLAIREGVTGDAGDNDISWKLSQGVPFVSSPILVDDFLYLVTDDGILTCVNSNTGKPVWKHRFGGQFSASPIAAGKRLYFCGEDGVTYVVRAGSVYRQLAENQLPGKLLASPAVSGNRIYLRTEGHLYCIGNDGTPPTDVGPAGTVRLTGAEKLSK